MDNILETSNYFISKIKHFGRAEKKKISAFMQAFQQGGFYAINDFWLSGYKVRNKSSIDIPSNTANFISKVNFVKKYHLWHFHAGFYDFDCDLEGYVISVKGDLTSQWVIHYQLFSDHHIRIVDISAHPPLILPPVSALNEAS